MPTLKRETLMTYTQSVVGRPTLKSSKPMQKNENEMYRVGTQNDHVLHSPLSSGVLSLTDLLPGFLSIGYRQTAVRRCWGAGWQQSETTRWRSDIACHLTRVCRYLEYAILRLILDRMWSDAVISRTALVIPLYTLSCTKQNRQYLYRTTCT